MWTMLRSVHFEDAMRQKFITKGKLLSPANASTQALCFLDRRWTETVNSEKLAAGMLRFEVRPKFGAHFDFSLLEYTRY